MRLHFRRKKHAAVVAVIDPRIRLLAGLLLLALVVSSGTSLFPWLVAVICLMATLASGMALRSFLLRLLHPLFIGILILLLKALSGTGDEILIPGPGSFALTLYADGLQAGTLAMARIMGAVSVAILLSQTMNFTETIHALAWFRFPKGLLDVALFAWRALFTLYDDAWILFTAQQNRLGYCGVRRGLRSFGSMAGMLAIRAFDGSQAMTTAMSQRGYDGNLPVSRSTHPGRFQFFGLVIFVLLTASAWKMVNFP